MVNTTVMPTLKINAYLVILSVTSSISLADTMDTACHSVDGIVEYAQTIY